MALSATILAPLAFAAAPDIDSVSPLAIRPGVPTEVTLSGSDLADARQLWTSFPARVERVDASRFRITADGAFGIGTLRVYGSNGVSGLAFVALDALPVVPEGRTNGTKATAQSVEFGSAVDGQVKELGYDWFRFRASKGQRVAVETVAARIGSKLDSVVRIVNAAGRELARNDDAPGWNGDSYLSFTSPESGDCFIEVRDVNYGGSSSFFYHLRVGDFPPVNRALAGTASAFAEKEPNDTPAKANKISLPVSVSGRFDQANDRDLFEFTARKGERLEFRAATRSLGSACDAVLQLDSANGKRLARSNPSAADEGVLTYSFPSNGTYRLTVEEVTGAFGSNTIYGLTSRPAAGFALSLDTDRVNVAPGKTFDLKVDVTRGDYKGAVTLGLEGLAENFALTNNVIAEGKSNVTVKVTAPATLTPGTWRTLSVTGTAKGGEADVRSSTAPSLRRVLPLVPFPPPELDGVIALGVTQPK